MSKDGDAPVQHLNWGVTSEQRGSINPKGRAKRCITCNEYAVVNNPQGQPQHKVCAEIEAGLRTEQP